MTAYHERDGADSCTWSERRIGGHGFAYVEILDLPCEDMDSQIRISFGEMGVRFTLSRNDLEELEAMIHEAIEESKKHRE